MTSFLVSGIEEFGGPLTKTGASGLGVPFRASIRSTAAQIFFDATVREVHGGELTMTEHPVEEGAVVTDHAQKEPEEIQIQAIISNRPIVVLASLFAKPAVPWGTMATNANDAYKEFERLQDTAALLFVSTALRDYEDMMLKSLSATVDKDSGEILDVTMRLRKFRTASVESIDAPVPIKDTHKGKIKQGRKQMQEASPEVTEKSEGALVGLANALGGFGG